MIKRFQVRTWLSCLFAATIVWPLALPASPLPPQPDPKALELDGQLQKLKEEALDINAQAQRAEDEYLYPDFSRVTIYLGVHVPGLLIKTISVSVDDGTATEYQFNELEAVVLQRQGLYPVVRLNAPPGTHRIRAKYSARFTDSKPEDAPVAGSYEAYFNKDLRPAQLELSITREGYLSSALNFALRDWRAAR